MCLKTLFLGTVFGIFLEEQKHKKLGYGDKTSLVLLTHILDTYG